MFGQVLFELLPWFALHSEITMAHNTVPYDTITALVPTQK